MRMLFFAGLVALPACIDGDAQEISSDQQDMRRQPGEVITVSSCGAGQIEDHGTCYNPSQNLPGNPGYGTHGGYDGGGVGHGGGGTYGNGAIVGYHEYAPGVTEYQFAMGVTDTLKAII